MVNVVDYMVYNIFNWGPILPKWKKKISKKCKKKNYDELNKYIYTSLIMHKKVWH